ncbi:MAG TPA: restriction endonuclease [Halanaerobiales bacterium]|nr:restriction endonuclease [Halanaerobiales bacterium]
MIPDYQKIMLPLLKLAGDEKTHKLRNAIEELADNFDLEEEERKKLLPSGNKNIFDNRVGWAKTYLKKAGLLEYPKRGYFKITKRGKKVLQNNPDKIDNNFLKQFGEFQKFKNTTKSKKKKNKKGKSSEIFDKYTPEEVIELGYTTINNNLASNLLEKIQENPPAFFEKLVVDLLVNMGYGGTIKDAGRAIGKHGDEGIDGVIKEDRLGLDIIYIQAKRWQNTVSRPEIQKFAGALQGKNAKKGIFITTSKFSKNAIKYGKKINSKIILINGEDLTKLMIKFDVGVSQSSSYKIKKVDNDYFLDE